MGNEQTRGESWGSCEVPDAGLVILGLTSPILAVNPLLDPSYSQHSTRSTSNNTMLPYNIWSIRGHVVSPSRHNAR